MPESIDTIDASELYDFVEEVTPAEADWDQNPELFRQKINEIVAAVNKHSKAIRTIGDGATVAGKVYYKSGSSSLTLLEPNLANLDRQTIGLGTGGNGEIQDRDLLTVSDLGFGSYPTRIYLGAGGTLIEEGDIDEGSGYWYVPLGVAESATQVKIEINRDNFRKFAQVADF